MGDLIADGVAWLAARRDEHLMTIVTYSRSSLIPPGGQYVPLDIAATRGTTEYEIVDESGFTVPAVSTDFIVSRTALSDYGNPKIGDQISVIETDGTVRVFEVLSLGGAGHYSWVDPIGSMFRIHTKLVSEI